MITIKHGSGINLMSLHNKPLSVVEQTGLHAYKLPIGVPSQLSDTFRCGVDWANNHWINVDDDLPNFTGRVLVSDGKSDPSIAVYIKYQSEMEHGKFQLDGENITDLVTIWRELPKLPECK